MTYIAGRWYLHVCTLSINTIQESECEKYVVIYITTQKYKYSVITVCDIILHKYYITRKYKSRLHRVQKIRTHELTERISRARKDRMKLRVIRLHLEEGLVLS